MNIHKFLIIILVSVCCAVSTAVSAQTTLPSQGDWWPAHTVSGTEEVTLTGDVAIGDYIKIPAGCRLIINGGGHRIKAREYNESVLPGNNPGGGNVLPASFYIEGELIIRGTESAPLDIYGSCTVDYGYDGSGNDPSFAYATGVGEVYGSYRYEPEYGGYVPEGTDPHMSNVFIVSSNPSASTGAKLTMEFVNIHDLRNSHYFLEGSVLDIGGDGSGQPVEVNLNHINISNCMSSTGRGLITINYQTKGTVNLTGCTLSRCRSYSYGGVIVGVGGGSDISAVVTMDNCEMDHCISSGWGGAILWACNPVNSTRLILRNCRFHHNYARCLGGAISNEGQIEMENCTVENNFAGYGGGGIASFPFSLAGGGGGEANGLVLKTGNVIQNNTTLYNTNIGKAGRFGAFDSSKEYPSGGGGIWILMNIDGWSCNAIIGAENSILNNTSAHAGGGVLLFKSAGNTTSLTSGATISGNTALSGGGIAIDAENVAELPSMTITGGEITNNTATAGNGGGVYMPGGIFTMTNGMISQNTASDNGGGFSIKHGTVSVEGNSEISYNNCGMYGAGLYVTNSESDRVSATFNGGVIKQNGHSNCVAGGGICVNGNIDFTTTASIEDNQALNGGGICVINGAQMTYESGLIRNNTAQSSTAFTTGYLKGVTDIQGYGGGVFVADNGSKLSFNMSPGTSLGLYGNEASNGGDDLFSSGNGTSIVLPNVLGMTLQDFRVPVPTDALFWAEDYTTNDPNYGFGTKVNTAWTNTNDRYRYTLQNQLSAFYVDLGVDEPSRELTCYTSLALGYSILFATIEKHGLKTGESAVINLIRDGETTPYYTVVLQGVDDAGTAVSKRVALYPGVWKAVETPWSWAYTAESAEIQQTISRDGENKFVFKNTPNATAPSHAEDIQTNDFE